MIRRSEMYVNRKLSKAFEVTRKSDQKKNRQTHILNKIVFENLDIDNVPDESLTDLLNDEKVKENDEEIASLEDKIDYKLKNVKRKKKDMAEENLNWELDSGTSDQMYPFENPFYNI